MFEEKQHADPNKEMSSEAHITSAEPLKDLLIHSLQDSVLHYLLFELTHPACQQFLKPAAKLC